MEHVTNYTLEDLQRDAMEIENKLHSDDRCQPMSGSEVAKLEWYLECYYREIMARECNLRVPALIETLGEYSDTHLLQSLRHVLDSLANPKLTADLRSDLEIFYLAIKYVLWGRNVMSVSVDIATLVAQMSDEELERAYKELALDVAHWHKKNKKRHAQLLVWQSCIVDETQRRNRHQIIQDFRNKWKTKEKEYNGDIDRMYQENFAEMLDDVWSMVEVSLKDKDDVNLNLGLFTLNVNDEVQVL